MLLVLQDAIFCGLQIHGPATLPFVDFTWKFVEDVIGVSMAQALNLKPLKLNWGKDFRGSATVPKLLHVEQFVEPK